VLVGVAVGVRATGPVADVLDRVGVLDVLDVVAGPQPATRTARAAAERARKVDC
jgi:ribosomal protein S5